MTVQVRQPTKKKSGMDTIAQLAPIAGAVIGGVAAGPGGAMAGAKAGMATGAMVSGGIQAGQMLSGGDAAPSAMERRMGGPQDTGPAAPNPIEALENARIELANQPPDVRQQYEPAIRAALLQARRGQGVA